MPYTHKKIGNKYVVYKKGKKVGETEGTKTALNKYLAALHAAEKPKKESLKESMIPEHWDHPGCEDEIGHIFVVLKPGPESSPEDIVHQTHAFGMRQFEPQGVHGIYNDEAEANLVAEAACTELRKHLEEIEGKKHTVTEKIDKIINKLQKEINLHMKEASELPEGADKAHDLAERKMATIKGLREKRKMVEASKKEIAPIEEKGKLKENINGGEAYQVDNPSEYAIYWLQKNGKLEGSNWLPKAGVDAEKGLALLKKNDNVDNYHVKKS